MHEDAAIGAIGHGVAGNLQPAGFDRIDAGIRGTGNIGAADAADGMLERQSVLAAAGHLAIVDREMGDAAQVKQPLRVVGQPAVGAIEH
jgi:hypothetical protein